LGATLTIIPTVKIGVKGGTIMELDSIVFPRVCNLLQVIEEKKYTIVNPIDGFYHSIYNQIDWIDGDDSKVIFNRITDIRDNLPRMIESEIKLLEIDILNLSKSREQIVRFLYEKLDLGPTDRSGH
jgi:hypothetical protein